jgi:hypothetical protein
MSSYPSLATGTGRNIDLAKTESDLAINIRKATSIEETAPKRKHVRSCIVYTWDHRSSLSFWAGMKGKLELKPWHRPADPRPQSNLSWQTKSRHSKPS